MLDRVKFQIKTAWPWEALILLASGFLIGLVIIIHLTQGIPLGDLVRDPNATANLPFYTGLLSQMGIFFWAATAAICFFSAAVSAEFHAKDFKQFFICSGALVLVMGLDDAFLLHENFFPKAGISEKTVFLGYALFLLYILTRFRTIILNTEFILLAVALFFFAISMVVDRLQHQPFWNQQYRVLLEDGGKFTGIVAWLVYYFRAGKYSVSLLSAKPFN